MKHCYNCGTKLNNQFIEGAQRKICPKCKTVNYENPIPSVAVVVLNSQGELLLTKRSVEPGIGLWCLPGGFIELGETLLETVVRETAEETGIQVAPGEIIDAVSKIGGYHGDVIIIGYTAEIIGGKLSPGDDAEEAAFITLDQLPPVAFKSHARFIQKICGVTVNEIDS